MASERPSVALLIETSNAYARGLLEGVVQYLREHDRWSVHIPEQGRGESPPSWIARWKGQGIIARVENSSIATAVRKTGLPVVDVSAARHLPDIAWVETDDRGISKLAARHFQERGFTNIAFSGDRRFNWSSWRRDYFRAEVENLGLKLQLHESPKSQPAGGWQKTRERMTVWLRELPKPIGILACYDIRAQQLLDACREAGLSVPDEVAILGVDNDELLCNLSSPPLSSVIPDAVRTGYRASELLSRMMSGRRVPPRGHLIPPIGIATRQSTDVLAIDDVLVADAVRYIRENACRGINVQDVLRAVPLSRRVLESRFRKLLGHTPHEEITRLRMERARQLLLDSDQPLSRIAQSVGIEHVEYLTVAFKRRYGVPPSQFRKRSS